MRKFDARVVVPAKARGKIAPVRMSHVVLNTHPDNYEAMVAWYLAVFEGEIAYANDEVAFLGFDEEHHRIAIAAVPHVVEPRPKAWGLNHFAFTYESLEQLLETYQRLKQGGITPYWPILHGPTTSLYYKDPDLNRVELLCDNLQGEELLEFFKSGAFDENFMGIIFDPDEMHAKLKAGVPKEELTRRERLAEGQTPWDMYRE
ncbi:MAG: VOC family protein [Gammaproteobacteria bacterium]|nr:VOC family protein [Gammaproteobacteria bacterium]